MPFAFRLPPYGGGRGERPLDGYGLLLPIIYHLLLSSWSLYDEGTGGEHSIERALTRTDSESLGFIVPSHLDGRVGTVLVVEVVALVLVESELAVGSRVDEKLKIIPFLL